MDEYFNSIYQLPYHQMRNIGRMTLGGLALAPVTYGITGGLSVLPILFAEPLVKHGARIRAIRIVAEAEGKTLNYMAKAPQVEMNGYDLYFSEALNQSEFQNLYHHMNKVYERWYGDPLSPDVLKAFIRYGNKMHAFCDSERKFTRRSIIRFLKSKL